MCERFGDDYWLAKDTEGGFPYEFHRAMAEAGWLGVAMPPEYGGSGLGIAEAAVLMQAVAESGAEFSGASAIHMNETRGHQATPEASRVTGLCGLSASCAKCGSTRVYDL